MNDLMTKSFLSYVELKKQAMKDLEAGPDIEMGKLDPADEQNLSHFFEEVAAIKASMEEITNLLFDLQNLNEEAKSIYNANVLSGVREKINSDMVEVLRKAKNIKTKLGFLDQSNIANRKVSKSYKEGSPVDRTRISVTNGLRIKLRDMMNDFQALREQILRDHKEGLKRRYFAATGEEASEEAIDRMISEGGKEKIFEGKKELLMENEEREEALKEIQRSLKELHQVFLDMAVLVETQGEHMNNIEQNMSWAGAHIQDGTKELSDAKKLKSRAQWTYWIVALVLILLFICLISTLVF